MFAFVGLNADGYGIDELFTVFVIDHGGGLAEVFARALTDTQPPAYYGLLYGWARVLGHSEVSLRALSAGLCVAAVAVFVTGTRGVFTQSARLFAAAAAATSPFVFVESQDARNYALCLLVTSVLLVLSLRAKLQVSRGSKPGAATILCLCVVGGVGAFVHFYEFLATGFVFLYLIVTLPSTRLRAALLGAGTLIVILQLAYIRLLLADTQQNIHAMWFGSDVGFFAKQAWEAFRALVGPGALAASASLGVALMARRPSPPARGASTALWSCGLGVAVFAGVIVAGIAITLVFAPSFSAKNLLVASPLAWPMFAFLFDAANPPGGKRWTALAAFLPAVAIAAQAGLQFERFNPRHEPWRETARYVLAQPGCRDAEIPVVFPSLFGQPTPFLRKLMADHIYGYYVGDPAHRLRLVLASELTDRTANPTLAQRLGGASKAACPVLAWAVHDVPAGWADRTVAAMAKAADVPTQAVHAIPFVSQAMVWGYEWPRPHGFVIVRAPPR